MKIWGTFWQNSLMSNVVKYSPDWGLMNEFIKKKARAKEHENTPDIGNK